MGYERVEVELEDNCLSYFINTIDDITKQYNNKGLELIDAVISTEKMTLSCIFTK